MILLPGSMVFFTVFATIDSLTLLVAMTGLLLSSGFSLKAIADLEYATWHPEKGVGCPARGTVARTFNVKFLSTHHCIAPLDARCSKSFPKDRVCPSAQCVGELVT